ncbi:hypothetical protein [Sandaracinus amylolyticus]|uniref:hypothetical protein n=1 Tax=Sandaracinus amylolyticus TaxID=927083 RepID=UPI0012EE7373|nr:hypothetical protein [Sandaracinus amylolyticus]
MVRVRGVRRPVVTLAIAAALSGCGEPSSSPPLTWDGDFVLSSTVFTPDSASSFVRVIEDPGTPAVVNADDALEVGGAAALFGFDGQRMFALGSSESPVITRHVVTSDGRLEEDGELSLAGGGSGVASAFRRPGLVPFVSPTKAYFIDDVTKQVLVWNPTEMTLDGAISFASADREGLVIEVGERAVVRGEHLFVPVRYRTVEESDAGIAAALVFEHATDSFVGVVEDDRCGDTVHVVEASDGTLYFGSGTLGATFYALQRPAGYPAPCVLRIEPGETEFDPDFYVSIPSLVGDRPAGRLVAGVDGNAYVLALHTELLEAPLSDETELYAPWEASAWRWWGIELGATTPGTQLESTPVASGAGWALHAGDLQLVTQIRYDEGRTTLLVPQADGSLRAGLDVAGVPYSIVRLQ